MRSKIVIARPGGEDKAPACAAGQRPIAMAGSLALVGKAETRTASAMKPGLY